MASKPAALKDKLRSFWDTHPAYWDALCTEDAVISPNRQRAASFIPEGSTILDVACGSAANSYWLAGRCRYFGSDISQAGLQRARERSLQLVCGDVDQLPFCSGAFDAAISTYALEHFSNPVHMLQEIHRVVRPGGRIVLLGPTWDLPFWYPNALLSRAHDRSWWLSYTLQRFGAQMQGWLLGRLPFQAIDHPDALDREFIYDADTVYIAWSYEIIRQMRRWGCRLVHWEVDDRLLGANAAVRWLKRIIMLLPPYRRAGSTTLLVFES